MATILIVDDIPANRQFLVTLLGHQGHRLLEAADGRAALTVVHAERPDLVITDVLMPVMDGYELVKQLRLDQKTRTLPVVFCTAHYGEREARALALANGVSAVLTKPAESAEVLKVVRRALAGAPINGAPSNGAVRAVAFDREHLQLLTDKLSEKAGDLRAANIRLRALINIGLELASERDPDRLVQSVCDSACELFAATYVTLGIVHAATGAVHRLVTCGTDATGWMKTGDSVPGILKMVVAERRTMRGDNPGGDPTRLGLPASHPDVETYLAVPVASPTQVYGWMCLVGNGGMKTFDAEDEPLVGALSGQAGRIYESTYLAGLAASRAHELEREILERKQAELDLRHERDRAQGYLDRADHALLAVRTTEERMRFALEAARIGIWDMDFATGVLQCSEILEAQFGLAPGTFGGTFGAMIACVHPLDRDALVEAMANADRSGADFSVQYRTLWPDGKTVRWLSGAGRVRLGHDGKPVRGVGISMDVTERHMPEAQYQQAQKMEAIGRLAGGIAHDFNNFLTVILGHCGLLANDLGPESPHVPAVTEMALAAEAAAALTRQLLAFSRKEILELTVLDLNQVIDGLRSMLRRLIGDNVTLVFALHSPSALVKADRGQLGQIVLNLAINARDAMPRGGMLTIQTADVDLDEHYVTTHFAVKPGPYVVLTVTDTGTGMTPEVQARLFEPFFTTKEVGRGTGLGLSTVHGIVARSGGSVNVYSEIGEGTSFKVYFPRVDSAPVPVDVPRAADAQETSQTVLVVEDTPSIRNLTHRLLERQGYRVLTAANAVDARKQFDDNPAIGVLLTDVVMPGTNGPELTEQLIRLRPTLKVIYMSGHSEDTIVHRELLKPGIAFLHKPFTLETLGQKLCEVIEG